MKDIPATWGVDPDAVATLRTELVAFLRAGVAVDRCFLPWNDDARACVLAALAMPCGVAR